MKQQGFSPHHQWTEKERICPQRGFAEPSSAKWEVLVCLCECGEFERISILIAIAVNEAGYRAVLGAAEGMRRRQSQLGQFLPVTV